MPRNKNNNAARKAKAAKMQKLSSSINRKMDSIERKIASVEQESKSEYNDAVQVAPTAYSKSMTFGKNGSNAMRSVKQRELIASVYGSTDFKESSFSINPGLPESFPWLHRAAADWQQYRFRSFKAIFISFVGAGTSGSVILSPEYNVNEGAPENEQEALNTQNSVQSNVWREIVCKLDVSAMFGIGPRKQIRRGIISSDLATYDAALLSVCTLGMSSEARVGSLYFEYEVDLLVPQSTQIGLPVYNLAAKFLQATLSLPSGTASGMPYLVVNNPLGVVYDSVANEFTLPVGNYRVDLMATCDNPGGTDIEFAVTIYINGTVVQNFINTGSTDTYGFRMMAPFSFITASNGTTKVHFVSKVTSANASVCGIGSNSGYVLFTLL